MFYEINLTEDLIERFIQLINSHAGLQNRAQDRKALSQKLSARMKSLKLSQPEEYYQILKGDTDQGHHEWRQLMLLLTTNETYFFRDKGQFSLLRDRLLPQLIEKKRQQQRSTGKPSPSLRLWSAGCSTGEEPYSLGILIKELIPDWQNWDIFILGTDINIDALERAKQGIFSSWSFRMVDPAIQKQYFQSCKTEWKLDETIRRMATLHQGNLVKDIYPNPASTIHSMDLIICRNVFVYFDERSISLVLPKFAKTLTPEGYLITGHAELYGQELSLFKSMVFPESIVYQRREAGASDASADSRRVDFFQNVSVSKVDAPLAQPLPKDNLPAGEYRVPGTQQPKPGLKDYNLINTASSPAKASEDRASSFAQLGQNKPAQATPDALLKEAESLFQKKAYSQALEKAQKLLDLHSDQFGAYYLMAQVYANLGNYHKARHYCERALSVNSQTVLPYYLLAHIAEEQGEIEAAKVLLKKIIYLAPDSIAAYLEMGSIYEKEGDVTRSDKMRTVALDLLKKLPANATVEQQGKNTAGELMLRVKEMLSSR